MLPPRRWRAGNPWQVRRATELVLGDRADDTLPENTSRLSGSHCMNRRRAFCTISTSELLEIDESEDRTRAGQERRVWQKVLHLLLGAVKAR